jgi:hypothetical protein
MLAFTVAVMAVAAAAGLGAFEDRSGSGPEEQAIARAVLPVRQAINPTLAPQFLTVTYVLVGSEEDRVIWDNVEETINQRELLSKLAYEVLVVTSAEQEASAYAQIEAARQAYPWNQYVIQDLRTQ